MKVNSRMYRESEELFLLSNFYVCKEERDVNVQLQFK